MLLLDVVLSLGAARPVTAAFAIYQHTATISRLASSALPLYDGTLLCAVVFFVALNVVGEPGACGLQPATKIRCLRCRMQRLVCQVPRLSLETPLRAKSLHCGGA
jgi:hypothetical protein